MTHCTSPESCASILQIGEYKASVSDDIFYEGYSDIARHPRSAFFMVHPRSDGMLYPFSIYPRSAEEGAAIKIMVLDASILLDEQYNMFYVASTPTRFGQQFKCVQQTHVFVVHTADEEGMEFATKHFTPFDKRQPKAPVYFAENQIYVATRVNVGDRTYPTAVMLSFCNGLKFDAGNLKCLDGKKIAFRNKHVRCPFVRCTFRTNSHSNLKRHYIAVHAGKKMYSCTECDKTFSENGSLKRHVESVHQRVKVHTCRVCTKSFSRSDALKVHMRSHEKETLCEKRTPNLTCSHCGKTFATSSKLKRHIDNVHEKKKLHTCPQCQKCFSQKGHLKIHVAGVHEKKASHRCRYCDKSFLQRGKLTRHVESVHENVRHVCSLCAKSFSQKGTLTRHIAKVHKKAPPA